MGLTVLGVLVTGLCWLLHHGVSAEEFNCTFDTNVCGWTQDQTDDFDWRRRLGATNTPGTGPSYDHTSGHGYYMYIESPASSFSPGQKARLISPAINVTDPMCLLFYYHMYGLHINTLSVYFSRNGSLGSPVWTKLQSQGNMWERATVQITGEPPTTEITNIVIEAVQGDYILADIAVDDVSLQAGTCPREPYRKVRLISPLNNGIGRIEVHHNGSWGTVCDNGFTDQAAAVACRQLGMTESWSKATTVSVAPGSGRIWLDDIHCSGNESSLAECDHSPWGSHSCSHSGDAGVNCDSEGLNCTFDTNACGWTQLMNYNFTWTRSTGEKSGGESLPNYDHTSGYGSFMYIETSHPHKQNLDARLRSPPINGTAGGCLVFYYHMFGPNVGALNVLLRDPITPRTEVVWTKIYSQDNEWRKAVVKIPEGSKAMQIMFKGVGGPGYVGSIAIDDVSLTWGTCQQEEFNCTFDSNICDWTQDQTDDFDWRRRLGATYTQGTGPSYDHTSGHGYYMYIESPPSSFSPGQKARLISPAINVTNQMCLLFYYHMYGLHINTLSVYFSRSGVLGSPVWTKLQSQGNVWERATVQITGESPTTSVTNIVFEAVQGDHILADIAIDDVRLQAGTCSQEPYRTVRLVSPLNNGIGRIEVYHNGGWGTVCGNGFADQAAEVACRQLGMTKSWSKPTTVSVAGGSGRIWLDDIHCSGNESSLAECDHSPWGSHSCSHSEDAGVNCDSEGLNCTFDTNACGWIQFRTYNFTWTRSTGEAPAGKSLPNSDHTSGYGSYMYIETSHPHKQDLVARLRSPPINGRTGGCLVFYYHMFGLNVGALNVLLSDPTIPRTEVVWTKIQSQGNAWRKAMVKIPEGSTVMHITFKGGRGPVYQGSIAIDDVSLAPGTCQQVTVPSEQLGSDDVHSWSNTIAIVVGIVVGLVIAVIVSVVIYIFWRRRRIFQAGTTVMPQTTRNIQAGISNPVYYQKNEEAEAGHGNIKIRNADLRILQRGLNTNINQRPL